ncbi:MAG: hypothetical protein ACSHYA_09780 [Opitutaceae bacterium]
MATNSVVLFFSHNLTRLVTREFDSIRRAATRQGMEAKLLFDHQGPDLTERVKRRPHFLFSKDTLGDHEYRLNVAGSKFSGNGIIPPLLYYKANPHHDYYWIVEQDVRFRGSWSYFFRSLGERDEDLLSAEVRPWEEEKEWCNWSMEHPTEEIPLEHRMASFNVIYRLSNNAMATLHAELSKGWRGHSEVQVATLVNRAGLRLGDIGGSGTFVPDGWEERFYISKKAQVRKPSKTATVRFDDPMMGAGWRMNTLYHPVKENKREVVYRTYRKKRGKLLNFISRIGLK